MARRARFALYVCGTTVSTTTVSCAELPLDPHHEPHHEPPVHPPVPLAHGKQGVKSLWRTTLLCVVQIQSPGWMFRRKKAYAAITSAMGSQGTS